MPIYTYKCANCGGVFDLLVTKVDSPPPICPECLNWEMERQIERPSPFVWGRGGTWH